ncbi:hypothetical protein N665_0075s0004 [Sinapis alba]|nr:hypothetical protein N665_0075s0004 [Sinapis alba]
MNNHWLAIWISIPKRHIVVWDNIAGYIRQAQLDQVMAYFVNMVFYLLVECAANIEEPCKYSLAPFTYETTNAPQCRSGDWGVFALKYIKCHALGLPFPGGLDDKNIKAIREQMTVDIFEEIPDAHKTETTYKRLKPDDFEKISRRLPPYDIQTTYKRLQPDGFHQTTSTIRLPEDFQTTSTRRQTDDFQTTSTRWLPPDD